MVYLLFLTGSISAGTNLLLINVLYFKSSWTEEFKTVETKNFFKLQNNPEQRINTTYMHGKMLAGYYRTSNGTEIISLSLKDKNYAMVFVIPQTGQYIEDII
jgi:serine protease inhibitor